MKILKHLKTLIIMLLTVVVMTGCAGNQAVNEEQSGNETSAKTEIIMATTTSTQDSGLLDYLLPEFMKDTGYDIKVVAVGTGQAIKMGEDGEADVLLVHSRSSEEEFVKAGHGIERHDVMYNDFVLVGPKSDKKVQAAAEGSIEEALIFIKENNVRFITRGDDSGTHKAELKLWKGVGIEPKGAWYISIGKGMGAAIQMADEQMAYTISDRATFLAMRDKVEMQIIVEGDQKLYNQYGVIAVNPEKNDKINKEGARIFIDWILSEKAQGKIGDFGKEEYGQSLFIPNAGN